MVKVFIFAGQSNAQGYGNRAQLAPVPGWAQNPQNGWEGHPTRSADTDVEYPHPTLANAPSRYNSNNTGLMSGVIDGWGPYDGARPTTPTTYSEEGSYGPELAFLAKYRAEHLEDELAVVKCVLGGSSLAEWLPPSSTMWPILSAHLTQAAARLDAEEVAWEWAGFVWMQGESGCSTVWPYLNDPQLYSTQLWTFLAAVRDLTEPALPVVIGRIGSHMLAEAVIGTQSSGIDTPANRTAATEHRRSQQVLVGGDTGNVWADTDDLPVLESGSPAYWYHHTGAGYLAMGERFYAAWQQAVGETPPPAPTPLQTIVKEAGVVNSGLTASVTLNGVAVGGDNDVLVVDVVSV